MNLQKMSFTDLGNLQEPNSNIEEALMTKNPKMEADDSRKMEGLICPEYLKKIILEEMEIEEKKNKMQMEKNKNKPKIVRLRVHYKLEVKTIAISAKKTFADLTEKVYERFNISDKKNCRLRLFNRIRDEMLDDFLGKEKHTLEDLKIYSTKNFIVEEKKEGEEFEEYDPTIGREGASNGRSLQGRRVCDLQECHRKPRNFGRLDV